MSNNELPKRPRPAGGFHAAAVHLNQTKLLHSFNLMLGNALAGGRVQAPKKKEEKVKPLTELGECGDERSAAAVVLKVGTHGDDHIRLRVRVGVLQQMEKAFVVLVVGHAANNDPGAVDIDAPGHAPGQGGEGAGFPPS